MTPRFRFFTVRRVPVKAWPDRPWLITTDRAGGPRRRVATHAEAMAYVSRTTRADRG